MSGKAKIYLDMRWKRPISAAVTIIISEYTKISTTFYNIYVSKITFAFLLGFL